MPLANTPMQDVRSGQGFISGRQHSAETGNPLSVPGWPAWGGSLEGRLPVVVVVDGVVAFVGSPNQTNRSLVNGELSLKVTGSSVATEVYDQAWAEAQRVEPY